MLRFSLFLGKILLLTFYINLKIEVKNMCYYAGA